MAEVNNLLFRSGDNAAVTRLDDLEIFARVAASPSMSAAAKALGLSPAVVSKRIKRLENDLGARLFQRTTRQIALTELGRGFNERISTILASVDDARLFVTGGTSEASGTLRVTAPTSFGRMHIAPHLAGLMNANPRLRLDLTLSDDFIDIVADGYDLAIRISELRDSTLVARKLASVTRILCASPAYIERHGRPAGIGDLKNHRCLPPHNGEPWRLQGPQGPVVVRPEGMIVTNSSEVVREAVIAGLGIALRSTWDVSLELSDGRLRRVLEDYEGSSDISVAAVYPNRQFLPAKVRSFIDYFAAIFGSNPHWHRCEAK